MPDQKIYISVPEYKTFKKEHILFGEIEDITPVEIILPDPPAKTTIVNYNRPIANQKWERTELPKSFHRFRNMRKEDAYNSLTNEEHRFILGEYNKILNGHWFYNNGELTWISGTNYMWLNWWKIDIGFPTFYVKDMQYFWHWWKVCNDPEAAGLIDLEYRRGGKSFRAGCIAYTETFTHRDVMTGIQSKTDDDGEKFFQKTIVKPWKRLPFFFHPEFDSSNNPRNELRFYSPTTRGAAVRDGISLDDALATNIEVRSAVETAFDGEKLHRTIQDEAGKNAKNSMIERWSVVKHCLHVNNKIIGKALVTSTVGEMNRGGGDEFKTLWDNSDMSKKEGGRTVSWLEQHYIPSYEGFVIDEFGRTKKEESLAALQKMFDAAKGKPFEIASLKRQFPRTLKEAFRSSANECRFNIEIIDQRLEEFTFGNPNLSYGNFKWKDGKPDTEVIFVPTDRKNGKFVVSYLFPDQKMSNKRIKSGDVWAPDNFNFGTAGADPFRYDEAESNKRSKGTGAVFRDHDPRIDHQDKDVAKWETNRYICSYSNRPPKYEYGEDMLMMCVYYGIPMFPEMNISFIMDYFKERGYGGFLLYPKDQNTYRRSKVPGANTNDKTKDIIFTEMDNYIDNHGFREVHTEILEAARDVDYNNLQPADLFVASGYALAGSRSKRISYKQAGSKSTSSPLFNTYNI